MKGTEFFWLHTEKKEVDGTIKSLYVLEYKREYHAVAPVDFKTWRGHQFIVYTIWWA